MFLKYVISYPFSPIFVAKVHHFVSFILVAYVWLQNRPVHFNSSTAFSFLAVFDLLSLLGTLLSVWLTVQKCYIVKLELGFTISSIVLLLLGSFCTFPLYDEDVKYILHAINIMHGYSIGLLMFAGIWAQFKTKNTISRLLIRNWGNADDEDQMEQLDFDDEL
ncbi:hypothetical protein L596_011836 [Steinernema carpocapsae]|uniref:Uncharacterized protein n=1 Tax=Steinernema carpocapsae TaxID=34508 RepID=A0A4U5NVA2_STECR|nr:hypothetical protein L596_011836 [Steinernema carpocapsae]